jgi:arylsulfatase A-like enzyme
MGFDEVIFPGSEQQYQVRAKHVTSHAISWLERPREGPFALWVHYYDPHEPYNPPQALALAFDRGYTGELSDALDIKTLVGLNDLPAEERSSPADLAHITDLYDAEIAYLDGHLGRLFNRLEALDLLDDTLVTVVGDHGQALGENSFFGHGLRLLEPVIKVPWILRLPGQTAPRRVTEPVETIDLFPTIAEALNLSVPAGLPGRTLIPALSGEPLAAPRYRIIERRLYPDQPEVVGVALHGGDWKAVYYRDEDGRETRWLGRQTQGLDAVNFYDPASDPALWLETARQGLQAAADEPVAELDEERERVLKALGYLD